MARRRKVEEHENHERWLVSYADFITLLFAFFVVMYSISSVNEGKYRVLSNSLESVFSDSPRSEEPVQIGELSRGEGELSAQPGLPDVPVFSIELPALPDYTPPPVPEETIRTINDLSQQLSTALSDLIDSDDVTIKKGDDWLELEMNSKVLFGSGEARLETKAVPIIGKIAAILQTSANPIHVEGFTDNNPINTPRFPSNWELSAARSASVVHLLERYGLNPSRMSAIGYGEFKPIADNTTEEGRKKNRRVVLVVLGHDQSRRSLDIFDPSSKEIVPSTPLSQPTAAPVAPNSPAVITPISTENAA
ncbi:flagellar motor protein MotD [Methylophaga sp. 42_25_T18]|nr:flagellar motor protein MotD [Methylophaga sp. 42_25_T18]OUR85836.1 flagellar motor protein MotD [Methylophaga sp. 42_8_T64]